MRLVDPEHGGISEGAEVVVPVPAVPDDDIVQQEADARHGRGEVGVEGVKLVLASQLRRHHHHTVSAWSHTKLGVPEHPGQRGEELPAIVKPAQVRRAVAVVANGLAVCGTPAREDVPVGGEK